MMNETLESGGAYMLCIHVRHNCSASLLHKLIKVPIVYVYRMQVSFSIDVIYLDCMI